MRPRGPASRYTFIVFLTTFECRIIFGHAALTIHSDVPTNAASNINHGQAAYTCVHCTVSVQLIVVAFVHKRGIYILNGNILGERKIALNR